MLHIVGRSWYVPSSVRWFHRFASGRLAPLVGDTTTRSMVHGIDPSIPQKDMIGSGR